MAWSRSCRASRTCGDRPGSDLRLAAGARHVRVTEEAFGEGAWRNVIVDQDLDRVIARVRTAHAAGRGAHVEYRIRHPTTGRSGG